MGRILGFVGWPCAGKDEAAEYFRRVHQARRFGHSDFIRTIAARQGNMQPRPEELSAVFEAQAAVNGHGWIARLVSEEVARLWQRKPDALVVVSGVRNLAEVEVYQGLGSFELVKIDADFTIRLERAWSRQRLGERYLTVSGFREIEQLPGNANIPALMALPGSTIVNNGNDRVGFHRTLDRLLNGGAR